MSEPIIKVISDGISPVLRRAERLGVRPRPALRAMGTTLMSLTMGNFHADKSYRPKPWPPKRDGSESNLQLTGNLSRSFHLTVSEKAATVATPAVYAAIHQFGGTISRKTAGKAKSKKGTAAENAPGQITMPARPFFPVNEDGTRLTPAAEEKIRAAGERAIERELNQ